MRHYVILYYTTCDTARNAKGLPNTYVTFGLGFFIITAANISGHSISTGKNWGVDSVCEIDLVAHGEGVVGSLSHHNLQQHRHHLLPRGNPRRRR